MLSLPSIPSEECANISASVPGWNSWKVLPDEHLQAGRGELMGGMARLESRYTFTGTRQHHVVNGGCTVHQQSRGF